MSIVSNYVVSGMTCGNCVSHVAEEVGAIPGVTDVTVQVTGEMVVTCDAAVDLGTIEAAVAEAGAYTVNEAGA